MISTTNSIHCIDAAATSATSTTTHHPPPPPPKSFRRLFHNDNDGTLLSRTVLIEKAMEFNHIVSEYHQRQRTLYTPDAFENYTTRSANHDTYTATMTDPTDQVYTEDRVYDVCRLMEQSFHPSQPLSSFTDNTTTTMEPVSCQCMGALHGTLSINCDYSIPVCTEPNTSTTTATTRSYDSNTTSTTTTTATCGKPQLGVTMVRGYVFSATTCISQYRRGLIDIPDTCVFVNSCEDIYSNTFCDCTASHNGSICSSCTICDGGQSMSVDCTNINPNAIRTTCQPIDLDLDLSHGAGQLLGFIPQLSGDTEINNESHLDNNNNTTDGTTNTTLSFCSQLESYLENQVTCDCEMIDASSSNYEISCSTHETKCDPNQINCGIVSSSIQIINGQYNPNRITTCTTYPDPFGETCTSIDYCNRNDTSSTTLSSSSTDTTNETSALQEPLVCGCQVVYNGNPCHSCTVCNDGNGINFDCTNVNEYAYSEQCQVITRASSYEYVPLFATIPKMNSSSSSSNNNNNNNNNTTDNTKVTSGGSYGSRMISLSLSYGLASTVLIMGCYMIL
jgi:hypothetical protein